MYEVNVAVCSGIRTKQIMQYRHYVEFLNVNLLKPTGYVMHQQV
jgi:hypothetical protein